MGASSVKTSKLATHWAPHPHRILLREFVEDWTNLFLDATEKNSESILSWGEMGIWLSSQQVEPSP